MKGHKRSAKGRAPERQGTSNVATPMEDALRRLIALANPQKKLHSTKELAECCALLAKDPNDDTFKSFSLRVFRETTWRAGLLRLLAFGLREVAARRHASWVHWHQSAVLVLRLLGYVFTGPGSQSSADPRSFAVTDEVLRLVISTDVFACLSQILATVPDEIIFAELGNPVTSMQHSGLVLQAGAFVFFSLNHLVARSKGSNPPRGLLEALRDSKLLEFLTRAVVKLLSTHPESVAADERLYARRMCVRLHMMNQVTHKLTILRSVPKFSHPALQLLAGPSLQHYMLIHMVTQLHAADGGPEYGLPPDIWMPVTYVDASCRDLEAAPPRAGPIRGRQPADSVFVPTAGLALGTVPLINTVDAWLAFLTNAHLGQLPVPHRAARHLCLRLANAANEALNARGAAREEARRGAQPQAQTAGAGADTCTDETQQQQPQLPPHLQQQLLENPQQPIGGSLFAAVSCAQLMMRSLTCALSTFRDAAYDGIVPLWRPIVRAIDALLELEEFEAEVGDPDQLHELLRLRLPLCPMVLPLEPQPSRPVAAALAAGYVPCSDKLLRRYYRPLDAKTASRGLRALHEHFSPFNCMTGLLLFGESRALASLIVTGAKIIRRAVTQLEPAAATGTATNTRCRHDILEQLAAFGAFDSVPVGANVWLTVTAEVALRDGTGPPGCWWLQHGDEQQQQRQAQLASDAAAGPEVALTSAANSAGSAAAGAGIAAGSGGAGSGSEGEEGGTELAAPADAPPPARRGPGQLSPGPQLLALASLMLAQWLPALVGGMHASQVIANAPLGNSGFPLQEEAMAAIMGAVSAWMPCIATACVLYDEHAAGGDLRMAQVASDWRRLLFEDIDILGLLQVELCGLASLWQRGATLGVRGEQLVSLLLWVAVVARPRLAAVMKEPLPFVGSPPVLPNQFMKLPAVRVLQTILERHTFRDEKARAKYELLLAGIQASGEVATAFEAQLCASGLVGAPRERHLMALMPPPGEAAGLLGLRLCSNPQCANLFGDAETALELSRCKGKCDGAVSYCGRACQADHWNRGHKKVCGKKASG